MAPRRKAAKGRLPTAPLGGQPLWSCCRVAPEAVQTPRTLGLVFPRERAVRRPANLSFSSELRCAVALCARVCLPRLPRGCGGLHSGPLPPSTAFLASLFLSARLRLRLRLRRQCSSSCSWKRRERKSERRMESESSSPVQFQADADPSRLSFLSSLLFSSLCTEKEKKKIGKRKKKEKGNEEKEAKGRLNKAAPQGKSPREQGRPPDDP